MGYFYGLKITTKLTKYVTCCTPDSVVYFIINFETCKQPPQIHHTDTYTENGRLWISCCSGCKIFLFVLEGIGLHAALCASVCVVCALEEMDSLSLSLCLQKDHTEPWYRRTQWGGSSAWLTRHSRNRKRDYLPEGLFGCVCMCVLTWVCECMHVCVHVCVYDIAFQLGTHSSLCHQGH